MPNSVLADIFNARLSVEDQDRITTLKDALEEAFALTCEQMGVIITIDNVYRLHPTNKLMLHLYRTNVYIRERKRGRGIHLKKAIQVIERHRGYRVLNEQTHHRAGQHGSGNC